MHLQDTTDIQEIEQTRIRRLRDLRRIVSELEYFEMTPLQVCEAIVQNRLICPPARIFFQDLADDEKHYWISSLYALLMPKGRRRRLAAYFTPPHLVDHAINVLVEAGIEPGKHRILDPASGGAAFLVPLASRIACNGRQRGIKPEIILQKIEATLAGMEIEPHLACLSRTLLSSLLRAEIKEAGRKLRVPIQRVNTLKSPAPDTLFDAVIGNPPYGRVFRPSKDLLTRFQPIITDGYVNLYALFIEQALRWVRPDGVICLIVPTSFVGGAYFAALRKRILETSHVLRLDPIDKRRDLFLDVMYDVCVLVLRKKGQKAHAAPATSALLLIDKPPRSLGCLDLPVQPSERLWALPDGTLHDRLFQDGLETLHDYGYAAKAGYFVWNREQHRYRRGFKPRANEVPLFWAHNIKPNTICEPHDGELDSNRIGLVKIARDSTAIVRSDAIILQRTSNRRQKRRLIAAVVRKDRVPGQQGFVSENHTIVIFPDPAKSQTISLKLLCRLLNTSAVDSRFRRISGSVSVSTKALRKLPLPAAREIHAAFGRGVKDDEAAEVAYELSIRGNTKCLSDRNCTRGGHDGR